MFPWMMNPWLLPLWGGERDRAPLSGDVHQAISPRTAWFYPQSDVRFAGDPAIERDFTFDEDRSQIRTGHGPRTMAALRNFAISLLRLAFSHHHLNGECSAIVEAGSPQRGNRVARLLDRLESVGSRQPMQWIIIGIVARLLKLYELIGAVLDGLRERRVASSFAGGFRVAVVQSAIDLCPCAIGRLCGDVPTRQSAAFFAIA